MERTMTLSEINDLFDTDLPGHRAQGRYATERGMSTVAPRISSRAIVIGRVAQRMDAIRQEAAHVRGLWQEFGWGELDEPGPQTESSIERGFRLAGPVDDEWGRSESLDPDNVGDIADEGAGHRG
jgi:hypothetical protein